MVSQNIQQTHEIAHAIRKRVFLHTMRHNGGYLSQACSAAEIVACLYQDLARLGPSIAPKIPAAFAGTPGKGNQNSFTGSGYHGEYHPEYDRLFISPAHYALIIYAALIEVGRMDEKALDHFNLDGGSVEMIGAEHSPGMEVTNGSLGQCLSIAAGVAFARKRKKDKGVVWVMMSDGELQEGQTWECFAAMHYHKLNNVKIIMDVNAQQCDGAMESVMSVGDPVARLQAFGATVCPVNGHDISAIQAAARTEHKTGPLVILAQTSPFQGMDYLEQRFPRLHYVRFTTSEEAVALGRAVGAQLGVADAEWQK